MLNRVNVPASSPRPDETAASTDIILIPGDMERPVFVDTSGRRRRRVRLLCYAFGVVCLAYSGLVAVSLAVGPVAPEGNSAFPALADGPRHVSPRPTPSARPTKAAIAAQPVTALEEPARTPPVPTPAPILTTRPPTPTPSRAPSSSPPVSPSPTPSASESPTAQPSSSPTPSPTRSAPAPTRGASSNPPPTSIEPSASPTGGPIGRLIGRVARVVAPH
jgi:hypothetical protein